jgi:hypothetical protein
MRYKHKAALIKWLSTLLRVKIYLEKENTRTAIYRLCIISNPSVEKLITLSRSRT